MCYCIDLIISSLSPTTSLQTPHPYLPSSPTTSLSGEDPAAMQTNAGSRSVAVGAVLQLLALLTLLLLLVNTPAQCSAPPAASLYQEIQSTDIQKDLPGVCCKGNNPRTSDKFLSHYTSEYSATEPLNDLFDGSFLPYYNRNDSIKNRVLLAKGANDTIAVWSCHYIAVCGLQIATIR